MRRKYYLISYLRNKKSIKIQTKERTILYKYQEEEELMKDEKIIELCLKFGFVRQAYFR